MKKLFLIASLVISSCISQNSFAAINAATTWEVRTTGNSKNGGGFADLNPGTSVDYSQQDSAQLALTDLATSGAVTTLTSATGGFTAAMVGNVIYIASGTNFDVGYYQITAHSDTNTVTLDRTPSSGGAGSSGVGNVGGATDHPQTISSSIAQHNTVYIAEGTYVKQGANAYVLAPSVSNVIWIGYNSATGRSVYPSGSNRPVFDGDSDGNEVDDTAVCLDIGSSINVLFKNLILKGGTIAGFRNQSNGSYAGLFNVRVTENVDGIGANFEDQYWFYCEIDTNSDQGTGAGSNMIGGFYYTYVHDNTNDGLRIAAYGPNVRSHFCVYESNGGVGLRVGDNGFITQALGNIAYNNTGASSDGFMWDGGGTTVGIDFFMCNNSSVDNGRYGFNRNGTGDAYPDVFFDFNHYNGNGSAGLNNLTAGAGDNTNNPVFTDDAGGDFTLNTGSDTALLGTGFPQTPINGLTGDYQVNIGLDQDKAAGAGGNVIIIEED